MFNFKFLTLFVTFVLILGTLFSQEVTNEPTQKRPKVGLVLSGGGAKGFAYIGLLKVLEEVNMPIDYIGGSSMGAITAALYSVGYSPETIAKIVRELDWDGFISDVQERKYIAYEEKLFSDKYIYTLPIKDKNIALGKSLNTSFNIDMIFNNLFLPVAHINDFNDLPIPFLCIGTDLFTGEAVVLNEGNLARAVRASMAIPGYFSPTEYNGKYLIDGGVVNNYPAVQVKEMGADIIIGGNTQSKLIGDIDDMGSIKDILSQVVSFSRVEANEKGYSLTDYMVQFNMPYETMDFSKYDSIIAFGEKVAREHYSGLKALADSINSIELFVKELTETKAVDSITIDSIKWPNFNNKKPERYHSYFEDIEGRKISLSQFEERMFQLNGTKEFDELLYEIEPKQNDSLNIKIEAGNSNWGSLAAGLHYDNTYRGSVLLNLSLRNIKGSRAKFFADLTLGQNPRLKTMFIINNGFKPGFGLESDIYSLEFSQYKEGEKVNKWEFDNFAFSAFMPLTFKNDYLFKAGFQYEYFRFKQEVAIDTLMDAYNEFKNYGSFFVSFNHDSRDQVNFTKKGQLVEIKAKHVFPFSDQWNNVLTNRTIIYLRANWYVKLSEKLVYKPELFFGYTFSHNDETEDRLPAVQHLFAFGGMNPKNYLENQISFTGLKFIEKLGIYAGKISTNFEYNFYPKLYATLMADVGFLENDLNNINEIELLFGYGAKLGYDSFVGPIEFSATSSNIDNSLNVFVNIGYWF
jgi:NTE family protein